MLDISLLFYPLIGAVAGYLAGLMGVGGGLIIVPSLWFLWGLWGWDSPWLMQLALGTSLTTIIFTSISSIVAHHRRRGVRWPIVGVMAPGLVIGVWLGDYLAILVSQAFLAQFFCLFCVVVAIKMLIGWKLATGDAKPSRSLLGGTSCIIGVVSALVGIGGGTMTVPTLRLCGIDMKQAVGTSAACGFPIALGGAIGAIYTGLQLDELPASTLGLIHLPAAFGIISASVFFAPMGARMAHRLSAVALQRIFAIVLLLVAVKMWFNT